MNFRQKVFLGIALFSLLYFLLTINQEIPVIPGWHYIADTPVWNSFSYTIFFLLIAVTYGFVQDKFINRWYFWLHVLLSIIPITLFFTEVSFLFLEVRPALIQSLMEENYKVFLFSDWIFSLNQLLFVLLLLIKKFIADRNLRNDWQVAE